MTERCRLLVDVREDANPRGFPVLALIAECLRSVELYRLGGNTPMKELPAAHSCSTPASNAAESGG
jgi:hypothetical protein